MRSFFLAAACAALTAVILFPSPSSAQTKTVKQCQDEWRANKANNVAKGIKKKRITSLSAAERPRLLLRPKRRQPYFPPPALRLERLRRSAAPNGLRTRPKMR